MEEKKLRVVLCYNNKNVIYYLNEKADFLKKKGINFSVDPQGKKIIVENTHYLFLTPDESRHLQGLRIEGWDEVGDVCRHPHYSNAVTMLQFNVR